MTTLSKQQEQTNDVTKKRVAGAVVAPVFASVLTVVLAVAGHIVTAQRAHPLWGAMLLVLATIVFLAPPLRTGKWRLALTGVIEDETGEQSESRPLVRLPIIRWALLINSLVLAGLAYWLFGGNGLDRALWIWLMAVCYFAASQLERPGKDPWGALREWGRKLNWRTALILLAIMALATFFRAFRLSDVPIEMTSDHAEKLLDVRDVLLGERPIFFGRNTGREAFQFYLTAALIRWTPLELGHLALKVGAALFGIVAVPATYLLGKELYGRNVGLLAAFFLAISHWHVTISRVGLRFPFTAAFATPAIYFLLRALRRNRRNDWLAAGAFLGVGLHTYTAMRIVPLLFILLVLIKLIHDIAATMMWREERSRGIRGSFPALRTDFWVNAVRGGVITLLLFLPLLRYMTENPMGFWYRALSRAQATMPAAQAWHTFWQNLTDALLMFNYRGDVVPMNTIPEAAALGPVTGGLFVLGMAYLLWRLLVRRELAAAYVLSSFVVLLLPSVLSLAFPSENPSVVRTGGAAPIVMIVASLPLALFVNYVWNFQLRRFVAPIVLAILFVGAVGSNYGWYFDDYDANIRRSLWNATEMGDVLREFEASGGTLQNAYHVAYPHWVDTRNIAINAGDITWHNAITDLEQIAAQAQTPDRRLYLIYPAHEAALKVLRENYPQGTSRIQSSTRPGKQFIIFETPAPQN